MDIDSIQVFISKEKLIKNFIPLLQIFCLNKLKKISNVKYRIRLKAK